VLNKRNTCSGEIGRFFVLCLAELGTVPAASSISIEDSKKLLRLGSEPPFDGIPAVL
jgi:hypothetical protein